MRKPIFYFDRETTSKGLFNELSKNEQEILNNFREYMLITASPLRTEAGITEIIRLRYVVGKPLNQIDLEDLRYFLKELKTSKFGEHTRNKIKAFIQRFLRWNFKDWSERFNEFEDISFNGEAERVKPITSKEVLSEEQIKQLLEAEPSLYWKTFLITQYEGALRTGECRNLKWENVNFEDDGFTTLEITSKKNRKGQTKTKPVVVKIAGRFLRELKEYQRKYEIKTPYVFPSPYNPNKPISKMVNLWFNSLCKKVLGKPCNNYLLRHSKGTQLQEKVRNGTLSKDNALEFMRHTEKMFDKVYSHMDEEAVKKLIKKQIYNTKELTSQEKSELEKQVQSLKDKLDLVLKENEESKKMFKILKAKIDKLT